MYRFLVSALLPLLVGCSLKDGDQLNPRQVHRLEQNAKEWCKQNTLVAQSVACANLFHQMGTACAVEAKQEDGTDLKLTLMCEPVAPMHARSGCYKYVPQSGVTIETGQ